MGTEKWRCHHCQSEYDNQTSLKHHINECHICELCNEEIPEKENLILHLKSHLKRSVNQKAPPSVKAASDTGKYLQHGFFHPSIRLPDSNKSATPGVKTTMKKPKTKYYIFKEGGKIKKVVRKIYKPRSIDNVQTHVPISIPTNNTDKKQRPSIGDSLDCNLDDLLESFEKEELDIKGM